MADYAAEASGSLMPYTSYNERVLGTAFASVKDEVGGGSAVQVFQMRAYHTGLTRYVVWDALAAPDYTGSGSGYIPGDLFGIVVNKISYQV